MAPPDGSIKPVEARRSHHIHSTTTDRLANASSARRRMPRVAVGAEADARKPSTTMQMACRLFMRPIYQPPLAAVLNSRASLATPAAEKSTHRGGSAWPAAPARWTAGAAIPVPPGASTAAPAVFRRPGSRSWRRCTGPPSPEVCRRGAVNPQLLLRGPRPSTSTSGSRRQRRPGSRSFSAASCSKPSGGDSVPTTFDARPLRECWPRPVRQRPAAAPSRIHPQRTLARRAALEQRRRQVAACHALRQRPPSSRDARRPAPRRPAPAPASRTRPQGLVVLEHHRVVDVGRHDVAARIAARRLAPGEHSVDAFRHRQRIDAHAEQRNGGASVHWSLRPCAQNCQWLLAER